MLSRPNIRTARCSWGVAIILRLADGSILMPLLLPSQAAEKRIHPKSTWVGYRVVIMLAELVSIISL